MARRLMITALFLFASGCSEENTSPLKPKPPVVTSLGETTMNDGNVALTLKVYEVAWEDDKSLSMEAHVSKMASESIVFDPGFCACVNPSLGLTNENADVCRRPRPLCPCGAGTQTELTKDSAASAYDIFPLGCVQPPVLAVANFSYSIMKDGEWVSRVANVTLPVD